MTIDLAVLAPHVTLTPYQAVGIPIALVGSVFLSLGAQFQHQGVSKVEVTYGSGAKAGLNIGQLLRLFQRPSWVFGSAMLALAIVCQLVSLNFAPLIVVQPLGAVALVITAILNARVTKVSLSKSVIKAIGLCIVGVGVFVTIAAFVATEHDITLRQLVVILITLGVVFVLFAVAFLLFRKRSIPIFYIVGAGVLYGFVATLAKVVITRITTGQFEFLTFVCVIGLLAAAAGGAYFVQTAYSIGSPDLVIAGLTVIDPVIAVSIGVIVLGEASDAPFWAVPAFVVAAAVAVFGVVQLSKHQTIAEP